eukprot:6002708-Pyramimonas_sp.AAC.1
MRAALRRRTPTERRREAGLTGYDMQYGARPQETFHKTPNPETPGRPLIGVGTSQFYGKTIEAQETQGTLEASR